MTASATFLRSLADLIETKDGGDPNPIPTVTPDLAAMRVAKIEPEERLVFGWAYVVADAEGCVVVDSHDEAIEPHELEKAAYEFMLEYRESGERHRGEAVADVIESLVLTTEKAKAMGFTEPTVSGWWVGAKVRSQEVFEKVKSGEYQMLSIQGLAHERTPWA